MTRGFRVHNVMLGGGAPVSVQSMTNTRTADYAATFDMVCSLAEAGADIVRVTLNEHGAVEAFAQLCATSPVPIVADIHYDYRLALKAAHAGAAKIRLNPGNLNDANEVRQVAEACLRAGIGVRIGVNAGSLQQDIEGADVAEKMVASALGQAASLEAYGLHDICLSVKSSDVTETYRAYRMLHDRCDYPLHLGVTECGPGAMALSKSDACIGGLLLAGIGDTLRFSLTDDPLREVEAGLRLLRALGLRKDFVNVIACPTCGRTNFDVVGTAARIQELTKDIRKPLTVAIMGCVVNGLGEGAKADIGVAGGKDKSVIFAHGQKLCTVDNSMVLSTLIKMIEEACNG